MKRAASGLLAILLAATASAAVVRVEIAPVRGVSGVGAVGSAVSIPSALPGTALSPSILGLTPSAVPADLPPAGPQTGLDAPQLRWLYRTLVADPSLRVMSRKGFSTLVLGHDMATAAGVAAADRGDAMYNALSRVVDSDLPPAERGRMADALNRRFAAILDEVLRQAPLSKKDRLTLARTKSEFLDDPVVLEELVRRRQILPRLNALEKSVQAAASGSEPSAAAIEAPAHAQWAIGEPIPKSERTRGGSVREIKDRLPEYARNVEAIGFQFEKLRKRWEIVSKGVFSPRFREKIRASLDALAVDSLANIRELNTKIVRIVMFSLPKGFIDPSSIGGRQRAVLLVPDNKNLRLRVEGDTALVTAFFDTDIADQKALDTIMASIEDYWQGQFVYAGKTMNFKTTVNIRKLAPGQDFTPGSLTLREAVDVVPHAGASGIVFSRDLSYDTPAHEFGHVLGLADEYTEGYRAADRTAVSRQNTESLMGALGGDILPRQLKKAYQLLRRRSLRD